MNNKENDITESEGLNIPFRSEVFFRPEDADDFFRELEQSIDYAPDFQKVYSQLNRVFQRILDVKTANIGVNFVGPFAKADYLLKENHAEKDLIRMVNTTRVRLRKRNEFSVEELHDWHLYDLRNISLFISFLFKAEVPKNLSIKFPQKKETSLAPTLIGDCIRMIADRWDNDYIYGPAEEATDGEDLKVCYSHGNKIYDFDWTYLRRLLFKGAQINLVRPRQDDDIIYPELIILEPDLLVDVTSVARCFTNYAESPFVNLISKLSPSVNSEPILLGEFASQMLDEVIHDDGTERPYIDSVNDFWKRNSIKLLTAGIGFGFHDNAKRQRENIGNAMKKSLPNAVASYDPKAGMVEPTFFCEMLGLSGRMDYLQLDYKVLLEQKSGSADNTHDGYIRPRAREDNYVQILLYMMIIRYNYREQYEHNNKELRAFLLYSKYRESLLALSFSPELMFRAIKIRNGIAWTELRYTQEDGYRFLANLTAESFNKKNVENTMWKNWQYVQLTSFLRPIQQATPLEKAYFFRFLTFISTEHVLSKLGNKTKENSGFASTWQNSLDEKLQAGNIYDHLHLIYPTPTTSGSIKDILFRFEEQVSNDMSNFRIGDAVILYPYDEGKEPDARRTMVFRCTIQDITVDAISLVLRAEQTDSKVFLLSQSKPWAIEHDFMESSYSSLYSAMHLFLSAPKERKDLLLLQRKPRVDTSKTLRGQYGQFDGLMTRVKQAQDFFLIIGPPGTGKTSFGMLNTLNEELLEPHSTILLLSYTNRAVDEICSKLWSENIDFIRIGGSLTCSHVYHEKLLSERAKKCRNIDELKSLIEQTRVFVATTSSMNANLSLFRMKTFSLAIIDEASQILEPHLVGLLCACEKGVPAIRKFVMIGDHKQLPAVVQQKSETSEVKEKSLNDIHLTNCRLSLFERLLTSYHNNADVTYMLTHQGRMHPDISMFPNLAFYGGQLKIVPLPHQEQTLPLEGEGKDDIEDMLRTRRIAFIDVVPTHESPSDKVNQDESDIIARIVQTIYAIESDHFDVNETIGIIVPYRNQIATIRNTIDRLGIPQLHSITIDTVERFQGSQRRYIIYGFTIQKYYQLQFLTDSTFQDYDGTIIDRKLNVAMTRAEEHLIMVGNARLLRRNPIYRKLITFCSKK